MNSSKSPRRIERRAVNAARTFFEDHDLVFQEIDLRNDIGKDGLLELARSGPDAGLSVALQIKGGEKYKRKDGHSIPIDPRLRNIWRNSSLPTYVIVLDPEDGELYWGNLIKMAGLVSEDARTIRVEPDVRLTPDGLEEFLKAARLECSARRSDPLLNLTSSNPDLLRSALFDCLVVGRHDARYLKLARSTFAYISDQQSFWMAIGLLAHATSHPDIGWHEGNIIPEAVKIEVRTSFRWTPNEIAMLLARMPEDEVWGRGTVAQDLYMILTADPSLDWSLDRLLTEAFRADELTWRCCWIKGPPFGPKWVRTERWSIIFPALTLDLYRSTDPRARLNELVERFPPIQENQLFSEIADIVNEFGSLDIF